MVKPQPESPARGEPSGGSSKYRGVRKRKWGKWVSEIRLPNSRERIWLGSYDSPEKAARAFDAAQYCLRGSDGVKFNFPDNPPDIAGERSLSPPEIQAFASSFANKSSFDNNNNAGMKKEQYTSSPSVSVSVSVSDQGRAGIQVAESNETVEDWSSFLSMLDTNQGMSDYGFFPGLGDQFYPPPVYDNVDDDLDGDGNDFPQHSWFLWNF